MKKFNLTGKITGVVHIGAHICEEMGDYNREGIPTHRTIWFEAQEELVSRCQKLYPEAKIYQAALAETSGQEVNLIITNNSMSSSLLELKEHLKEHPHVHEVRRDKVVTTSFEDVVKRENLDLVGYNFLNIDIQGMELPVLKGMRQYLDTFNYLYLEVNTKELYADCKLLDDIDTFLKEKGFNRVDLSMTRHGWGDAFYLRP